MRKPKPNTLPVTKVSLDALGLAVTVLFIKTNSASFSLYSVSEYGEPNGPIMEVDGDKPLHCELLSSACVGPGARLAYLAHDLSLADNRLRGTAVISLLGHNGPLENGCITIDIPRDPVVAGYIEFDKDEEESEEEEAPDENEGKDEDGCNIIDLALQQVAAGYLEFDEGEDEEG